jgi:hypothetical protein
MYFEETKRILRDKIPDFFYETMKPVVKVEPSLILPSLK